MPKVLTTNQNTEQEPKKSTLGKLADWAGAIETGADITSLYGPASAIASPIGGGLGVIKEGLLWGDGQQTGLTSLANGFNALGWGIWGMIPEAKVGKYLKRPKWLKLFDNAEEVTTTLVKPTKSTLKRQLNTATENLERYKKNRTYFQKLRDNVIPSQEMKNYNEARKAYNDAIKVEKDIKAVKDKWRIPRYAGKVATSGAITYGLPGTSEYIIDNSDGDFTPNSLINGLFKGAIGNGFNLLTQDVASAITGDWNASSRLARTFIAPSHSPRKEKKPVPPKNSQSKKVTKKKPTTEKVSESKKFGGKFNSLKELRL